MDIDEALEIVKPLWDTNILWTGDFDNPNREVTALKLVVEFATYYRDFLLDAAND